MKIKVSEISEDVQRTHLLGPDEVLTLRKIETSQNGKLHAFLFEDEAGYGAGRIYDFQLPETWVAQALAEQSC